MHENCYLELFKKLIKKRIGVRVLKCFLKFSDVKYSEFTSVLKVS